MNTKRIHIITHFVRIIGARSAARSYVEVFRRFIGSLVTFHVKSCHFSYLGLKHRHIDRKDEATFLVRPTLQRV